MRDEHRHPKSADGRHRTHPAETHRTAVKDLVCKDRHQCRRTAKQNGKQIQRDRSEDYISTEHKPQPGHETLPSARVALVSFLRAAADEYDQKEERKRAECIKQIYERKPDVRD